MRVLYPLLILLAGLSFWSAAWSHHSTANFNFDKDARVLIKGKATYFSFTNPHSFLKLEVPRQNGEVQEYIIFMTARAVLQRQGWRPQVIQYGDVVEIEGSPDHKKPNELYLQRIVFANGEEWRRDSIAE